MKFFVKALAVQIFLLNCLSYCAEVTEERSAKYDEKVSVGEGSKATNVGLSQTYEGNLTVSSFEQHPTNVELPFDKDFRENVENTATSRTATNQRTENTDNLDVPAHNEPVAESRILLVDDGIEEDQILQELTSSVSDNIGWRLKNDTFLTSLLKEMFDIEHQIKFTTAENFNKSLATEKITDYLYQEGHNTKQDNSEHTGESDTADLILKLTDEGNSDIFENFEVIDTEKEYGFDDLFRSETGYHPYDQDTLHSQIYEVIAVPPVPLSFGHDSNSNEDKSFVSTNETTLSLREKLLIDLEASYSDPLPSRIRYRLKKRPSIYTARKPSTRNDIGVPDIYEMEVDVRPVIRNREHGTENKYSVDENKDSSISTKSGSDSDKDTLVPYSKFTPSSSQKFIPLGAIYRSNFHHKERSGLSESLRQPTIKGTSGTDDEKSKKEPLPTQPLGLRKRLPFRRPFTVKRKRVNAPNSFRLDNGNINNNSTYGELSTLEKITLNKTPGIVIEYPATTGTQHGERNPLGTGKRPFRGRHRNKRRKLKRKKPSLVVTLRPHSEQLLNGQRKPLTGEAHIVNYRQPTASYATPEKEGIKTLNPTFASDYKVTDHKHCSKGRVPQGLLNIQKTRAHPTSQAKYAPEVTTDLMKWTTKRPYDTGTMFITTRSNLASPGAKHIPQNAKAPDSPTVKPSLTYDTPSQKYELPTNEYLPPNTESRTYLKPLLQVQETPSATYFPSTNSYTVSKNREVPSQKYTALLRENSSTYKVPSQTYEIPTKEYLPSTDSHDSSHTYKVPSQTYEVPAKEYLPPTYSHTIPHAYKVPSQSYEVPTKEYLPPTDSHTIPHAYKVPSQSYEVPTKEYLPPTDSHTISHVYKVPSQMYEVPTKEYLPPTDSHTIHHAFKVPSQSYEVPTKEYLPPTDSHTISHAYKVPSQSYEVPTKEYLPPTDSHTIPHAYKVPSQSYEVPTKEYLPPTDSHTIPHAYKVPSQSYEVPTKEYLPPTDSHTIPHAYKVPSQSYEVPTKEYLPPTDSHTIPHAYKVPSLSYEVPTKEYLPPTDSHTIPHAYKVPSQSYEVPTKEYLPPTDSHTIPHAYKVPSLSYEVPTKEYLPPTDSHTISHAYKVPSQSYEVPTKEYLPPTDSHTIPHAYKVPSQSYEVPTKKNLPPTDSHTHAYKVPSQSYEVPTKEYLPPTASLIISQAYKVPSQMYEVPQKEYLSPNNKVQLQKYESPRNGYLQPSNPGTLKQNYNIPSQVYEVPTAEYVPPQKHHEPSQVYDFPINQYAGPKGIKPPALSNTYKDVHQVFKPAQYIQLPRVEAGIKNETNKEASHTPTDGYTGYSKPQPQNLRNPIKEYLPPDSKSPVALFGHSNNDIQSTYAIRLPVVEYSLSTTFKPYTVTRDSHNSALYEMKPPRLDIYPQVTSNNVASAEYDKKLSQNLDLFPIIATLRPHYSMKDILNKKQTANETSNYSTPAYTSELLHPVFHDINKSTTSQHQRTKSEGYNDDYRYDDDYEDYYDDSYEGDDYDYYEDDYTDSQEHKLYIPPLITASDFDITEEDILQYGYIIGIPGIAGIDYPILEYIPLTSFRCHLVADYPGYYADMEAGCQVFHVCRRNGRQDSFLCPNGTIFNQKYFVCDWWYNFSCEDAIYFYPVNANLEYTDVIGQESQYDRSKSLGSRTYGSAKYRPSSAGTKLRKRSPGRRKHPRQSRKGNRHVTFLHPQLPLNI